MQVVTLKSVLQIGTTKETIEVTSEAPLADTTSTQLASIMDAHQVSTLPLNPPHIYHFFCRHNPGYKGLAGPIFSMAATQREQFQLMAAAAVPITSMSTAETGTTCSSTRPRFSLRQIA